MAHQQQDTPPYDGKATGNKVDGYNSPGDHHEMELDEVGDNIGATGNGRDYHDGSAGHSQAVGFRDIHFKNNDEELKYLLSLSDSRAPSPDMSGNAKRRKLEPSIGEEERDHMNRRLVYHLSVLKATNANLVDIKCAFETKQEATERKMEALKQELAIYNLNMKNELMALDLEAAKLHLAMNTLAPALSTLSGGGTAGQPQSSPNPRKRGKNKKLVHCIECFRNKTQRKCDGNSPYWPCAYLGKECKRMRCKYFNLTAGTCPLPNCTLAHSDSGFPEESLEHNHHVAQLTKPAPVIPPKPTTKGDTAS